MLIKKNNFSLENSPKIQIFLHKKFRKNEKKLQRIKLEASMVQQENNNSTELL